MRAPVDMNDAQMAAPDRLAKRTRQSRAALIRAAIDDYLHRHRRQQVEDGFGPWGKGAVDGLAFQDKARSEW